MATKVLWQLGNGTTMADVQIPNSRYGTPQQTSYDQPFHPQKCDVYIPNGPLFTAICFLHGGGGTKDIAAAQLTVKRTGFPVSPKYVNWTLLSRFNTAVIIPQGSWCTGVTMPFNPGGVTSVNQIACWSSHFMWSQADDPQFLIDMNTWIKNNLGNVKRMLAGHSAGGIMAQRQWYESYVGGWSHFAVAAGPAAEYYLTNGAPPTGGLVKPLFSIQGGSDTTLNTAGGHFFDAEWHQDYGHINVEDVVYPLPSNWIGETVQIQTRINAYNTANSLPPETFNPANAVIDVPNGTANGRRLKWSYSGGANLLWEIENAEHQLIDIQLKMGSQLIALWGLWALSV